jgi:hypothetical protein
MPGSCGFQNFFVCNGSRADCESERPAGDTSASTVMPRNRRPQLQLFTIPRSQRSRARVGSRARPRCCSWRSSRRWSSCWCRSRRRCYCRSRCRCGVLRHAIHFSLQLLTSNRELPMIIQRLRIAQVTLSPSSPVAPGTSPRRAVAWNRCAPRDCGARCGGASKRPQLPADKTRVLRT